MELRDRFIKQIPNNIAYTLRVEQELHLINSLGFDKLFLQVLEVIKLLKQEPNIPFITRGSVGSSLVAYLLGISDIDPIKFSIGFERFINPLRPKQPDIDLDVPWFLQDEAHNRIRNKWPETSARISNHLYYSHKGSLRAAMRELGVKTRLPRKFNPIDYNIISEDLEERAKILYNKRFGTSLHCGGVVIKETPFNKEDLLKQNQLIYNKDEVEAKGWLKIDVLSNRGLGQLHDISKKSISEYPESDRKTSELLGSGSTIGVTQAESPAFRKMLRAIQPRSVHDLIIVTALIRPGAASRGNRDEFLKHWKGSHDRGDFIVFEDDATNLIDSLINCGKQKADYYRRGFASNKENVIAEFADQISNLPNKETIISDLSKLKEYSMCLAHSVSYGRMIWALAYNKVHNAKAFWHATLNNCQSQYRTWVHIQAAKLSGWDVALGKPPFKNSENLLHPVPYTQSLFVSSIIDQYKAFGYWTDKEAFNGVYCENFGGKTFFKGLIATYRRLKKEDGYVTFVSLGIDYSENLIDIVINDNVDCHSTDLIEGSGIMKIKNNSAWIEVETFKTIVVS